MTNVEIEIIKALGLDPTKFTRKGSAVKQTMSSTTVEITFSRELEPQEAAIVNEIVRQYQMGGAG